MNNEKENKTKTSQIKAVMEYDKRKGNTTITCKVKKEYKEKIEMYAKKKGYKSINAYLLALIENDMSHEE